MGRTADLNQLVFVDSRFYLIENRLPRSFNFLKNVDFGCNPVSKALFKMSTFPELISLAFFVSNSGRMISDNTKFSIRDGLIGDTLILKSPEYVYRVDHPKKELVDQLDVNNRSILERIAKKLDRKLPYPQQENGVVFSEDGFVARASIEDVQYGKQSMVDFSDNPGVYLLAGSRKRVKQLECIFIDQDIEPNLFCSESFGKYNVSVPIFSSSFLSERDKGADINGTRIKPNSHFSGYTFGSQEYKSK